MAKFYYQAITENGSSVSGAIDADSAKGATNALVARGYIPQKITDASKSGIGFFLTELQEKLTTVKLPELIIAAVTMAPNNGEIVVSVLKPHPSSAR